jgi:hypothetical protein
MSLSWENVENAIKNLMEFNKAKSYTDFYNLKPKNLVKINDDYYIVEEANHYSDWSEYGLRNILTNQKAYMEIDAGELSLWEKLNKIDEKNILLKINEGKCKLLESGRTDEYKYKEYLCDEKIFSLEEYPDGSNEIYQYIPVIEGKII